MDPVWSFGGRRRGPASGSPPGLGPPPDIGTFLVLASSIVTGIHVFTRSMFLPSYCRSTA
eukprot:scaffold1781_cov416-Prasinococcus_capsulatus_cf.AAC.10